MMENKGRMGETMEAMAPVAASLGVDIGVQAGVNGRPVAPVLNVLRPILEVCNEVGQLVRNEGLYMRGERVVTIDSDGVEKEMDERRFISFLPRFCVVSKGKDEDGAPRRIDLSAKRGGEILASDTFRNMLPRVTRILPARLPVYTKDGQGVRLLPKGYDPEHQVFVTADAPEIREMHVEDAVDYWRDLYRGFPWGDSGRSFAAQLAAQVGMFVQMLFPDALAVPLFFWNANTEGSGKSILAETVLAPIYGTPNTTDFGQGEEFVKELAAKAFSFSSYLFLDDLDGFIKSQTLNRWVVQAMWSARRMHSHDTREVPKRCMTMVTGNRATLSDDLVRRAVIVDLFSEKTAAERLAERDSGKEITSPWLARRETRSDMLSALWAMVRFWAENNMTPAPRRIASFVEWTDVVGGIIFTCGLADPFAPAKLADAGDKWQVEWETLFSGVVRRFKPDKNGVSIPLPEWCAVARECGLYVDKLGELELTMLHMEENSRLWKVKADEPFGDKEKRDQALRYMHPQKQASPFAKILRKRGGQVFDVDGRKYRFADRNTSTSTFLVREVTGD
jgi:hypothetical protein